MVAPPSSVLDGKAKPRFDGKLSRDFVLLIVLLSLLPLMLVGAATHIRSRQLLRNQAAAQLEIITRGQVNELEQIVNYSQSLVERIRTDEGLRSAIDSAIADPEKLHKRALVVWQLDRYCRISPSDSGFHTLAMFLPDRTMLAATDSMWRSEEISNNKLVGTLLGTNQSIALYNPQPFYPNQFVIFTAFTIPDEQGQTAATLIGSTVTDLPRSSLVSASTFFIGAKAYYHTQDGFTLGIGEQPDGFAYYTFNPDQMELMRSSTTASMSGSLKEYRSPNGQDVLGYTRWVPGLQIGLLVEVPLDAIYQQLNIFTPINTAIFVAAMLFSITIVYLASRQVVQPLLMLVSHARRFSAGDWSQRVNINRKDEIGLLAHTFNGMVEQLSDLYQSLEMKVNERSRQIRLASEIGHIATSTQDRSEVIQRTVSLVVERFNYTYAAIYRVEESGLYAILEEESLSGHDLQSFAGVRLRIGSDSLVGWVASENKARVITDNQTEIFARQLIQAGVRSEAAVPIAVGNLVYGVLDVQSTSVNAFDSDAVAVLQTLANHISSGLQNIHLLETAQFNLQETALLYRASRQISQAADEVEVLRLMANTFKNSPYVSGLYAIQPDHIRVIAIHDGKEPSGRATAEGITLPLKNIPHLLEETRLILLDDISAPSEFVHILSFYNRCGCRSAAIIPIHENSILAKMVVLGARENQELTETVLQPYTNLLSVASTTLARFRILKTLEDCIREVRLLTNFSQQIAQLNDPEHFYPWLHRQVEETIGCTCEFILAVNNPIKQEIDFPYTTGSSQIKPIPLNGEDENIILDIIRSGKPLLINSATRLQANESAFRLFGKHVDALLGIPLIVGQNTIGAMILQDIHREDRFTHEQVEVLTALAPQIATVVRNQQLVVEIQNALRAYHLERFLLDSLLEYIPDQIYFKNANGQYMRVSSSYANQFDGNKPEDLIGQNDVALLGYERGMQITKTEQEILTTRKKQIGLIEYEPDEDGDASWRLTNRIPLFDEKNQHTILLAILRDITNLERAEERARRNAQMLRIAAEIARDTSSTLEIDDLLRKAVNLVRERFGFYHASIFLMDETGEFAVLEESTGIAGQQMKESHHKLQKGSRSVIGQVTLTGETLVINDVTQSTFYYANPLLPETAAELAIPLKIGEQVLGALDVQSNRQNTFLEQDVAILQILADQISVAVYNARLFARTQDSINRHRTLHEITTAASLALTTEEVIQTTVNSIHTASPNDCVSIYLLNSGRLELRAALEPESVDLTMTDMELREEAARRAVHERKAVLNALEETSPGIFKTQLAVPIVYSRNVVGALVMESSQSEAYDEYDQEIMGILGSSIGPILYNAYLMSEVRQQVERERLIYEATNRIHRSVDIQTILKTSAAEIARAVGARAAKIELNYDPAVIEKIEETA